MSRSAERGSGRTPTPWSMIAIRIFRDSPAIPQAPSNAWFASGWPSPEPPSPAYRLILELLPFVSQVLPFETFADSFIWPHARRRPPANRQEGCDAICRLCSADIFRTNTEPEIHEERRHALTFGTWRIFPGSPNSHIQNNVLVSEKVTFSKILGI